MFEIYAQCNANVLGVKVYSKIKNCIAVKILICVNPNLPMHKYKFCLTRFIVLTQNYGKLSVKMKCICTNKSQAH